MPRLCLRTLAVFPLLLALAALTPAQLSGGYTIDSSSPTGGTNYDSFVAAAAALAAQGVSGPVVFVVAPAVTPYAGWSLASPVTGASAINTIHFLAPSGAVISGPATPLVQGIHLGGTTVSSIGPSFITLEGLEVTGVPSGAGMIFAGCSNITVRNCRVHTCGGGITFVATTDSVAEDNEVYAVGNTVGTPGNASYSGGLTSYYNSHGNTIQRNRIHDCTGNGIFLGSSGSTTSPSNNTVINNMVWNTPGLGSYPGGIAIRRSAGSTVSNNSVWMPAGTSFGGIHLMSSPQPAEISNNIVKHDGTGACFRFESASTVPSSTFDYNHYDPAPSAAVGAVGATLHATLGAWQALASPNLAGKEVNTVAGAAGFLSPTDLHITPGSLAFNSGSPVAAVTVDIDLQSRPIAAVPDRGADETPATGLFPAFAASTTSGTANLSVAFSDQSFSSAMGGVATWAWDFQNDGIDDATVQNPVFVYTCPGTYSVKLTITDATNPTAILVRTNLISVGNHSFDLTTSGGGVGDLTVTPVPTSCGPAAGAVSGWTLISFTTPQPVGFGPFLGIVPDGAMFSFLLTPPAPGNIAHFIVSPGLYPDAGPVVFSSGVFSALNGLTMDAVMVFLAPSGQLQYLSNVDRVTF